MPNKQKRIILSLVSAVLFVGIISAMLMSSPERTQSTTQDSSSPVEKTTETTQDSFSYSGKEGVDALTLLEEQAEVEKTPAGFVTSINGRKADDAKREYWSFYVNGEPASVGAGEYQTATTDTIEWKIETY